MNVEWPAGEVLFQEALWNIRGLKGSASGGGGDCLDSYSLSATHRLVHQITAITLMFGIRSDLMVAVFLFVSSNGRAVVWVSLWQENSP